MICVFDIETIPDFHLLQKTYGYEGSPFEIAQSAFEAQKQKTGSEFLSPCFHRVVSISSVICDDYGHFNKVGNFAQGFLDSLDSINGQDYLSREFLDTLESTLVGEFWSFINKSNPKLVSFNGRGFDLPTLNLRAMRYNISAEAYFEQNNPSQNKSKWENYRQRYSELFHTDLFESLGNFSMRNLNLDSVCKMLDLVGKYDMSGDQVFETYLSGENTPESKKSALQTINHYCHSDVLNTYWLYLKYELHKGVILETDYFSILEEFAQKLPKNKPYSEIFFSTIQDHLTQYQQTTHR